MSYTSHLSLSLSIYIYIYIYIYVFRARLPPYLLDFGHVVLGTVRTHIVRATNTGWFPASFSINTDYLYEYGFSIELDRVKNLPGAPDHETVDFEISFDPRGANLGLGEVATIVPINVSFHFKINYWSLVISL